MTNIEDDGFATIYPALTKQLRAHDRVECPIDNATATAAAAADRIAALEAEVARLTSFEADTYETWKKAYADLQARLTAMEANADALAEALRDGAQGWTDRCDQALATHAKLKEGK